MNISSKSRHSCAFTLPELIVVIAVILLLIVLVDSLILVPISHKGNPLNGRCMSNLKNNALVFYTYAEDHQGLMPWQEFADALNTNSARSVSKPILPAWQYLTRCSNYYGGDFRLLLCPADISRASNRPTQLMKGNDSLSYFLNPHGQRNNPITPLMGDRNLASSANQALYTSTPEQLAYVNPSNSVWKTTQDNQFHQDRGNLLFYDGHVEILTTKELQNILSRNENTNGTNANRFLFPQ